MGTLNISVCNVEIDKIVEVDIKIGRGMRYNNRTDTYEFAVKWGLYEF